MVARILFLLLISISAQAQFWQFSAGLRKPSAVAPPAEVPTLYSLVDDDNFGTGKSQVEYTGSWVHDGPANGNAKLGCFEETYSYWNVTNTTAVMDFDGTGIDVYFNTYPSHGIAAVSVDGGAETMVDLYGPIELNILKFSRTNLTNGAHTITVRVTGTRNASSSEYYVEIDAFGVYTPTPVTIPSSGDWFVDADMVTSGNGQSHGADFKTIQEAANVAQPGDTILIYAGDYRETITPANGGNTSAHIVYMAAEAGATVSGLNEAGTTGWTVYSGNIYQKTISLPNANNFVESTSSNTVLLANQVFKDGVMMHQARWPNIDTPEDMFDKSKFRGRSQTTSWTDVAITDTGIGAGSFGNLTGAYVWVNGWYLSQTRQITSSSGNTINYSQIFTSPITQFGKHYFITNKLSLLDVAKEWQYESGILYFYQSGGGSPTGVEYKARNWGFNLSSLSNITIIGLEFIGCDSVF